MTAVAVTLTGNSDYVVAGDTCATAPPAPGASCSVTVRFIPTTPGSKTTTLSATGTFMVAGANQTDTSTVAISGNATPAAQITVDPATHDFGMVAVDSAGATQMFRVANGSDRPTTGGVEFDTTQATADFTVTRNGCVLADNTTPRPLAAGESCTFDVRFTPRATGARAGVVRVFANPGGSVAVRLGGIGLTTLLVEPGAFDFDGSTQNVLGQPNASQPMPPRREFTITNRGVNAVALTTSIDVDQRGGRDRRRAHLLPALAQLDTGAGLPAMLAGGASCQVRWRW